MLEVEECAYLSSLKNQQNCCRPTCRCHHLGYSVPPVHMLEVEECAKRQLRGGGVLAKNGDSTGICSNLRFSGWADVWWDLEKPWAHPASCVANPPINQAESRLRTRAHDRTMPSIEGNALSNKIIFHQSHAHVELILNDIDQCYLCIMLLLCY